MPLSWNEIKSRATERMGRLHDQLKAIGCDQVATLDGMLQNEGVSAI